MYKIFWYSRGDSRHSRSSPSVRAAVKTDMCTLRPRSAISRNAHESQAALARTLIAGNFLDMLDIENEKGTMDDATRPVLLSEPACDVGCRTCFLECAVLPQRLAWWEGEVERLHRERVPTGHPRRQHWRDHLQACEAACADLRRQLAATRNREDPLAASVARHSAFQPTVLQ